ncbi:FAD-dependent oxidoreductase, partial [Gammaproteobacteria bacterium AH-315-E17]|nr:FAD-dependent oxidoreductase [Gammaproteobacteria bacterium AH-315-E17]
MAKKQYEIIVIGSGPAGESAAMNAAKSTHSVAMICDKPRVGGNSAYHGTIPSKALRNSVRQFLDLNNNPMFRDLAEVGKIGFETIIKHAEHAVDEHLSMNTAAYERNKIPVIHGSAQFVDKNTITVNDGKKSTKFKADHFIIATGSRPYRPEFVDFNHPRVFDSDTILKLSYTPSKVTIIGAGVIGCEYASIFGGLGINVELINPEETLLSFLDTEITDALSYHLGNLAVRCRHQEHYDKMQCNDDAVITYLQSGKKIKSDIVLWANGRTGNTDKLN